MKPLDDFHDIFAGRRFDIGIKNDFKVIFRPLDESPANSQKLPTPINYKGDITVELSLLHKYGKTTEPTFSKYASSFFARRNWNDELIFLLV